MDNLTQIAQNLLGTLNHDVRQRCEENLREFEKYPKFLLNLLSIVEYSQFQNETR